METTSIESLSPLIQQADQWGEVLLLLPLLVALEAVLSADNAIALAGCTTGNARKPPSTWACFWPWCFGWR